MIKKELLQEILLRRDESDNKERWLELLYDLINNNLLYYLKHIDRYRTKTIVMTKNKYGIPKSKRVSAYTTCGICGFENEKAKFDDNGLCFNCEKKTDYFQMLSGIDLHDSFDLID